MFLLLSLFTYMFSKLAFHCLDTCCRDLIMSGHVYGLFYGMLQCSYFHSIISTFFLLVSTFSEMRWLNG